MTFINDLRNIKPKIRDYIYLDEIEQFIRRNEFFADFYDNVFGYASSESTFDAIHKTHMKKYTKQKQQNLAQGISEEDDILSEDLFSQEEYKFIYENFTVTLVLGFIANLENQLKEVFRLLSVDIPDKDKYKEKKNQFIESLQNANIPCLIEGLKELNLIDPQLSSINTINTFYTMINVHKHGKGRAFEKLKQTNKGYVIQDQNDDLFPRLIGKTSIKIEKEMVPQIKKAIDELWTDIKSKNKDNMLKFLEKREKRRE